MLAQRMDAQLLMPHATCCPHHHTHSVLKEDEIRLVVDKGEVKSARGEN